MIKKIVVVGRDWKDSEYEKELTETLCGQSIELEFWDLGKWFFPEWSEEDSDIRSNLGNLHKYRSKSWKIFLMAVFAKKRNCFYLFRDYRGRKFQALQMMIKGLGGRYAIQWDFAGPGNMLQYDLLPEKRMVDYFPPDVVFTSCEYFRPIMGSRKSADSSKIRSCGSVNYWRYVENEKKNPAPLVEGEYALFIDENLAYHIERKINHDEWVKDTDSYIEQLDLFFRKIEEQFEIKVVLAAHHSSHRNQKEYDKAFGKRERFWHDTVNLVKYCKFAFTYASTAVDYCVLYHKPVLLYNNSDMDRQRNAAKLKGNNYMSIRSALHAKDVYIDKISDDTNLLEYLYYDRKAYTDYLNKYIYPPKDKEYKSISDIIVQYLREI